MSDLEKVIHIASLRTQRYLLHLACDKCTRQCNDKCFVFFQSKELGRVLELLHEEKGTL